ncbi:MAG: prephenate dehydrogenase/arogenate dehydrogenase family protein [Patescibacteria group bacterium]
MIIAPKLRIGIIGGTGKTGSQFARLFQQQGFNVNVTGSETSSRNAALLRECDIIIFSVPLSESVNIITKEMSYAKRKDQLLLDLSSLKSQQISALLNGAGEVIGLHPLFGPWTDATGETVVVCPARANDETVDSLEHVLSTMGLCTKRMTAEAHDHFMGLLQVLPHVKNLLVARTLQILDADIAGVFQMSTPPYELELNVVGRFLDDNPDLYGSIIIDNPDSLKVLTALRSALDECICVVEDRDLPAFSRLYEGLKRYFGDLTKTGRDRSEACISLLASFSSSP